MQKVTCLFISVLLVTGMGSFTITPKEKVNWLTVAELQIAYKQNPKPILIDLYTDWCGWCKVMDKETYAKENVAKYINEHYYALKYNAESKDPIEWDGKKYVYNATYKANEFAVYLAYGNMSFPTTVFLSAMDAQPAPLSGYLKPAELESPLKFFGDGAYKTKNYPEFMKTFSASW